MKKINARGRGRTAASFAVTAALLGGGAAATTGPAVSAVPVPADNECNAVVPDAAVAKGDPVSGLTVTGVSSGTAPVEFTGEIIGMREDGIAPGVDMIMARLDIGGLDGLGIPGVDGIWAGMSGSPVYAADNRLIGAVAYGLTWGSSDVAGITPYEAMSDHLPPAASQVAVSDAQARQIASLSDVSASAAEQGFSQLRVPQLVTGLTSERISRLTTGRRYGDFRENRYLNKRLAGGGSGFAASSTAADLVPGGNLAATVSYGDITSGGVGTVTAVCEDHLVGFGHPAMFSGRTSLTMHPADALYVQNDPLGVPFKVANFGAAVGTIDGDHLAGISGFVGGIPDTTTIASEVTWPPADGYRRGQSFVSVKRATASTVFYEHIANHDVVIDGIQPGSESLTWTIEGTEAGNFFSLGFTDRYASSYDITFESAWELADLVWHLSSLPDVDIDLISSESEVDDDSSSYRVTAMAQRRNGAWVPLTRRRPAVVSAGGVLDLRATMTSTTGATTTKTLSLDVPKQARKGGYVYVAGGGHDSIDFWGAENVTQVEKAVANGVQGDQLRAGLSLRGMGERRISDTSSALDKVVFGERYAEVIVRP